MKEITKAKLNKLCIRPDLSGFDYIVESVEILKNNGNNQLTLNEIHQKVNEKYNCNYAAFERAIRYCIEIAESSERINHTTAKRFVFDLANDFI